MAGNTKFAVALHVILVLAKHEGGYISSDLLAESVRTNPVVIRRLLGILSDAGLVETKAGKAGGARLARGVEEITAYDIYLAVLDDELFPKPDKGENRECVVSCSMKRILDEVSERASGGLKATLGTLSVGELLRRL